MGDHYTYRVSWSEEDQEYVGTCAEFPGLSHLDASRGAALQGIEALVRDIVAEMEAAGGTNTRADRGPSLLGQVHDARSRRLAPQARARGGRSGRKPKPAGQLQAVSAGRITRHSASPGRA